MKYKEIILDLLVEKYQKRERNLNIFLALTSSGSIAAWAVWQKFPIVWGAIIAASQVVMALKPYFPFNKIVKELNNKCLGLGLLNNEYERFYFTAKNQALSDKEIEDKYFVYADSYTRMLTFSEDLIFDTSNGIQARANEKMKKYFTTRFGLKPDSN